MKNKYLSPAYAKKYVTIGLIVVAIFGICGLIVAFLAYDCVNQAHATVCPYLERYASLGRVLVIGTWLLVGVNLFSAGILLANRLKRK